jgi:hypothetical protein
MSKRTTASEPQERPYKTNGIHLPADLRELRNQVALDDAPSEKIPGIGAAF